MKILKFLLLLIFSGALFGSCSSKDKVGDEQIRIIPFTELLSVSARCV